MGENTMRETLRSIIKKRIVLYLMFFQEQEDGKLKRVAEKMEFLFKKDFIETIFDNQMKVEFCGEKPDKFQMNTIYLRRDGKMAYFFGELKD